MEILLKMVAVLAFIFVTAGFIAMLATWVADGESRFWREFWLKEWR